MASQPTNGNVWPLTDNHGGATLQKVPSQQKRPELALPRRNVPPAKRRTKVPVPQKLLYSLVLHVGEVSVPVLALQATCGHTATAQTNRRHGHLRFEGRTTTYGSLWQSLHQPHGARRLVFHSRRRCIRLQLQSAHPCLGSEFRL